VIAAAVLLFSYPGEFSSKMKVAGHVLKTGSVPFGTLEDRPCILCGEAHRHGRGFVEIDTREAPNKAGSIRWQKYDAVNPGTWRRG
jgi:hypothetical protein